MKFIKVLLLSLALLISFSSVAGYVSGYTKSNGTYVEPYYRSDRNSTVTDNYSYYGNTNPYTGSTGTNKYYDSPSSDYYTGTRSNSAYSFLYDDQLLVESQY